MDRQQHERDAPEPVVQPVHTIQSTYGAFDEPNASAQHDGDRQQNGTEHRGDAGRGAERGWRVHHASAPWSRPQPQPRGQHQRGADSEDRQRASSEAARACVELGVDGDQIVNQAMIRQLDQRRQGRSTMKAVLGRMTLLRACPSCEGQRKANDVARRGLPWLMLRTKEVPESPTWSDRPGSSRQLRSESGRASASLRSRSSAWTLPATFLSTRCVSLE